MKISDYIIIVLLIGMSFTAFAMIITDFETQYPDVEINKTSWEGEYNYSDAINVSASSLKSDIDKIGDETGGWQVFSAIVAIPKAVLNVVSILFLSIGFGLNIFSGILNSIGVPPFVSAVGTVIIIIVVLFAAISFYHRSKA